MLGRNVAVGVILHHVKIVLVCQLQNAMRTARGEAVARGVMKHADTDIELGLMRLAIPLHYLKIGAVRTARYWQDVHPHGRQTRKLYRPTRLLDHDRITGSQQRAADNIERMRGAHRGDDVLGHGVHIERGQLLGQQAAQAGIAQWLSVLERKILQITCAGHLAHRGRQKSGFQPLRRKHTHAWLRLVTDLMEHAPNQCGGVNGRHAATTASCHTRRRPMRRTPVGRGAFRCEVCRARVHAWGADCTAPVTHKESPVFARFDQALCLQLVVSSNDGGRTYRVLRGTLAHRRQTRPRRQQSVADTFGKAVRQLLGQRLRRGFHQHGEWCGKARSRVLEQRSIQITECAA